MEEEKVIEVDKFERNLKIVEVGTSLIIEAGCTKLVDNIVDATMPANVKVGAKVLTKIGGCFAGITLGAAAGNIVTRPIFKGIREIKELIDAKNEMLSQVKEDSEEEEEDFTEA